MKKNFSILMILGLVLFSINAQTTPKFIRVTEGKGIPNSYVVVLAKTSGVSKGNDKKIIEIAKAFNLSVSSPCERGKDCLEQVYSHALTGFSMSTNEKNAVRISQNPLVEYVAEDIEVNLTTTQNNATWGLDRIDSRTLLLDTKFNYTSTGNGVNVYVIDSGIKFTHTEFGGRAVLGKDFIGDGLNGNDCQGHGTHVAGTIGGATYGVAKNSKLFSVRVFPCSGPTPGSTIIAAVNWVTANHIKPAVVNMSLGSNYYFPTNTAVANSIQNGITYTVAAGNGNGANSCTISPASVKEAITVGASTNTDARAIFSNIGTCVDLFAPGQNITSAGITSNFATAASDGTSMAAPHVAGVAALYLEKNNNALPAEVATEIHCSASSNKLTNIGTGSPNLLLYSPLSWEDGPTKIKFGFIPRCGFKKAKTIDFIQHIKKN